MPLNQPPRPRSRVGTPRNCVPLSQILFWSLLHCLLAHKSGRANTPHWDGPSIVSYHDWAVITCVLSYHGCLLFTLQTLRNVEKKQTRTLLELLNAAFLICKRFFWRVQLHGHLHDLLCFRTLALVFAHGCGKHRSLKRYWLLPELYSKSLWTF